MEEHERIELRSDDVQEIIGTPPRWIVRWGTFIVSTAVILMIAMSFFVKYPDKVRGAVTVTSKIAPVRVKAQRTGRIDRIFVEDGSKVEEGELLLVMQDAADYEDMEALEEFTNELQAADLQDLMEFLPIDFKNWEIGSLQQFYSQVQTDFKELKFTEENQIAAKRIAGIKRQMFQTRESIDVLERQLKDAERQSKLAFDKYKRYKEQIKDPETSAITQNQFEEQQQIYLQTNDKVKSIENQIIERQLSLSGYDGQITTILNSSNVESNDNSIQLEKSINNLIGEIDRWKEHNLLIAAIDGKISMVDNWSEKQSLTPDTEILAIIPNDGQDIPFIQLFIPVHGSGKVKVGQQVLLKFDNYPYREYGQVDGIVVALPGLSRAQDNAMPVKIKLTNGLITRSKKELKFEQEMRGIGEIITEDRTVFARIFENIIQPFQNK